MCQALLAILDLAARGRDTCRRTSRAKRGLRGGRSYPALRGVSDEALEEFEERSGLTGLGEGEGRLLARLYLEESEPPLAPGEPPVLPADVLVATADIPALRALHQLGWLADHVVSLEWLAGQASVEFPPEDRIHHRHRHHIDAWMDRQKRRLLG